LEQQGTFRNTNPLQIKVVLKEPLRSQFISMRNLLSEDNAGLVRIAIRQYIESRAPSAQVPPAQEATQ
jgi:hypothetical protein